MGSDTGALAACPTEKATVNWYEDLETLQRYYDMAAPGDWIFIRQADGTTRIEDDNLEVVATSIRGANWVFFQSAHNEWTYLLEEIRRWRAAGDSIRRIASNRLAATDNADEAAVLWSIINATETE